ncbi:hypothetical protein CC80DRAFT_493940 [Byssothecium circinans]|uniref:20S-pre-rRNA D-site endonuclease NOB1 n=1 Tax=Byssothecium circinans TaxID=147558 RepID=A0A6A5TQV5_9PLEO|nr:hypothetical protein CC80DRAFT_493940 [Byssothecium circinans]
MAQKLSAPPQMASTSSQKPIHSVVIDTGPLINNTISISTIIGSAEQLYTTPAIISEIRDAATRSRVETTLMPFLNIKTPTPASYEVVAAFAKKTGDFSVLSRQDLGILALAYEVHCERHGGSFGLRDSPGKPVKKTAEEEEADRLAEEKRKEAKAAGAKGKEEEKLARQRKRDQEAENKADGPQSKGRFEEQDKEKNVMDQELEANVQDQDQEEKPDEEVWETVEKKTRTKRSWKSKKAPTKGTQQQRGHLKEDAHAGDGVSAAVEEENSTAAGESAQTVSPTAEKPLDEPATKDKASQSPSQPEAEAPTEQAGEASSPALEQNMSDLQISQPNQEPPVDSAAPTSEDDSEDDWITPDNLTKQQAKDFGASPVSLSTDQPQIPVATMTTDYAMQNVLLQMNLNLLSPAMQRIRKIRTTILRCQACFHTTKQMDKQFCPSCGGPTMARVSCSTDAKGVFRIHLSKNYQVNKRGNKYSVPKPVAGTANGKLREKGGGQGGWGRDLVLSEDQKEYTRRIEESSRMKTRDLMDADYLPGILTGHRERAGGRPKVGAGKTINSRKKF